MIGNMNRLDAEGNRYTQPAIAPFWRALRAEEFTIGWSVLSLSMSDLRVWKMPIAPMPVPTEIKATPPPHGSILKVIEIMLNDSDDQSWFWTEEWQAGEAEATRDIEEGNLSPILHTVQEIREHLLSS